MVYIILTQDWGDTYIHAVFTDFDKAKEFYNANIEECKRKWSHGDTYVEKWEDGGKRLGFYEEDWTFIDYMM